MVDIIENKEKFVTNDDFTSFTGKIQSKWGVRIGYISSEKLSAKNRYVTQTNYDELRSAYKPGEDKPLTRKFMGTTMDDIGSYLANNDPKKRKTMDFNFGENISIVNYTVYALSWLNQDDVADIEQKKNDELLRLRQKYGFGEEGAENTWRNKHTFYKTGEHQGEKKWTYGGPGLMPQIGHVGGNKYNERDYSDEKSGFKDELGNIAYRQKPTGIVLRKYYLIDETNGNVEELDENLFNILSKKFGAVKAKAAVDELEKDEAEYVRELNELNGREDLKSAINFLKDKTLWMTYSVKRTDKTIESKRWINPQLEERYSALLPLMDLTDKFQKTDTNPIYECRNDESVKKVINLMERIERL